MVANPAEKKNLIRQAAIRAFSHKGFYNTRAEEIAREAGIAVGTIYNYFVSKEEILLSIFGASEFSVGREGQRRYSLRHERQRLVRTDSGD